MNAGRDATRPTTRRRFLALGAGGLAGGTAGCLGGSAAPGNADGDDGPTAVASFFTFFDYGRRLAEGTAVTVENLVPTGLHGHGWEPDPSIQRRITDADAFVHVGPDFQPWADRAIDTLADEAGETAVVNAREGIDLIDLVEGLDEDEAVESGKDPHFWLDPERAKRSVRNIADGLIGIAPDAEARIRENATALESDLDDLDAEWESTFDVADRDVVFLAAHNAFGYLADRYGTAIEPLVVNLAADGDVRPADMRRAQETIATNEIRHIGAAVFEPIRPARRLLEQTRVDSYYPVTPYAGTAESWAERGWGYFDIARRVNLPTFRILLGIEAPEDVAFADYGRNFEP